ncbi:MAG: hypothetical protein PHP45_09260 [Elusimicrobiales bacterium]|nr:hypothetical protein [Elusimicrobiales bacterium]
MDATAIGFFLETLQRVQEYYKPSQAKPSLKCLKAQFDVPFGPMRLLLRKADLLHNPCPQLALLRHKHNKATGLHFSHETHEIHENEELFQLQQQYSAADERGYSQIKNKTAFVCLYPRKSAFICG